MILRAALVPFAATALLPLLAAQAPQRAVDPYTRGAPAAMARAGVVGYGPFPFGSRCTSTDVEALLPEEPLLWLETAHFRIGCALPALALSGDREHLAKWRDELQRLAAKLPGLKPTTRTLDPWLRLHLAAQRAEGLYAEVQAVLGVTDADFPAAPGDDPRRGADFRGLGPFLGNPAKFTILLLQKGADLRRYTSAYHAFGATEPTRHHDHELGTAFFGLAEDGGRGLLRDDLALRSQSAYHLAMNLYTSYRGYGHLVPGWLVAGLAHHHARAITTRFPVTELPPPGESAPQGPSWERRAQALRKEQRDLLPALFGKLDVAALTPDDHVVSQVFVEWLLDLCPRETAQLLHRLKDPFHERQRFPTEDELHARQRDLLQQLFRTDAAGLEELWRRRPAAVAKR